MNALILRLKIRTASYKEIKQQPRTLEAEFPITETFKGFKEINDPQARPETSLDTVRPFKSK
jgi:hypothetical protein